MAFRHDKAYRRLQVQNSVNSAYIITMTELENLTMQLQYAVQKYGENAPVAQELRQQVEDLRQQKPGSQSKTQDAGESGVMNYHAGFRKQSRPTTKGMKTRRDIPKILSPDELLWLRVWLSEKQILEGINSWTSEGGSLPTEAQLGASRSVIFDVLEAARARVEAGLPPYGKLWEEPSEEERRKSIEASRKRVES